jgi:GNAT superfamily N-acetyltransferase
MTNTIPSTEKFDGLYAIRGAEAGDRNFVIKSFLLGLYYGESWFSAIPKDIFMLNYKSIASALVDSPKNLVVVACLPDDPTVILGYSILSADGTTIHWVYVKQPWRRRGIMTKLLPVSALTITHLTALGQTLKNKLKPGLIFNPFAL